jgi:raffinose/stachyose/melibiose transport system permease protein
MSTVFSPDHMNRKPLSPRLLLLSVLTGLLALVFLAPFYFVLANSVKTYGEILRNAAAFPEGLVLENYQIAFRTTNFVVAFFNSVVITTFSLVFMVLLGAMAAWRMVRRPHRLSKIIFGVFVVAMVVPFQSVMIPMMKVTSTLNLLNSRIGMVVI